MPDGRELLLTKGRMRNLNFYGALALSTLSGCLCVDEGTLYPALHRLARRKLVDTEWGISENNRRAKYYRLKPAGRARLRQQTPAWHHFVEALARALSAPEHA